MTKTDLTIVGLGYVGLPLAHRACESGLKVVGYDTSADVIQKISRGESYVDDISDADIEAMCASGFTATTEPSCIAQTAAVALCVPTPLSASGGPDLASVITAAKTVSQHLRPGTLVVVESTTYPGSTEEDLLPLLEQSGLKAGKDFWLAFSPERVDPGNKHFGIKNTPKIVGGLTADCTNRAVRLYTGIVDQVVRAKGIREAEMAKLLENTYRHVNIALVNEMAKFSHEMGIDIWDVIDCAATKPFGYEAFRPGPGVGGHCIPIDPNYLSYKVHADLGYRFRFVELAQEINASMPFYVVQRAGAMLNSAGLPFMHSSILLLGVTYKQDIADERESPAVEIAKRLVAAGANVLYHDPYVPQWAPTGEPWNSVLDPATVAHEADLVVLLQAHSAYRDGSIPAAATRLLDTRGNHAAANGARL